MSFTVYPGLWGDTTERMAMSEITPFLWFDTEAEEAATLYTSLFPNSRILEVSRFNVAGPGQEGNVMTVSFEVNGQRLIGMNGGPGHPFTDAVSLSVNCETQEEVDRYWNALTEGGREVACGWLVDRYGLSWQIVPEVLPKLLMDPDRERAARAMAAMMDMVKLDIDALERAADGETVSGGRPS
jgi:predicted 3-demethylubiquinone-9 3-methyltransferase (glyoxalase superfamily)